MGVFIWSIQLAEDHEVLQGRPVQNLVASDLHVNYRPPSCDCLLIARCHRQSDHVANLEKHF